MKYIHLFENYNSKNIFKILRDDILFNNLNDFKNSIEDYIKNGGDISITNSYDQNILIYSIDNGCDINISKYLINLGFDLNYLDKYNKSALVYAINNNNIEIIELLVKSGSKINYNDRNGNGIFDHIFNRELNANDEKTIRRLIELGMDINYIDESKKSALYTAILYKNVNLVKFLIKNGYNLYNKYIYNSITPIIYYKYDDIIKNILDILLTSGLDINMKNGDDTILSHLIYDHNIDLIKILIKNEKLDINMTIGKYSYLDIAYDNSHYDILELLLTNFSNILRKYKDNIFLKSVKDNNLPILKMIIKYNININKLDELTQDNALNISTFNDNYEISEILILKNISINNINTFNITPLYNVIYNNNYKLCELLVKSDADINQICDNYMRTPLSLASTLNNMEIIELLIYYGADESILDYSGKSFYSNLDYYHKDLILSKYPTSVYTALVSENKFNGTFMEFLKINKLN